MIGLGGGSVGIVIATPVIQAWGGGDKDCGNSKLVSSRLRRTHTHRKQNNKQMKGSWQNGD